MNIGILLSGGVGTRIVSDIPKQYIDVNGKMIIEYSLASLMTSGLIDGVIIVADIKYHNTLGSIIKDNGWESKMCGFALPGKTRQMSIYNALQMTALKECSTKECNVFIHDAARPNLTVEMIEKYISAINGHEGLIPVLPMKDTVYLADDGRITKLLERNKVVAGQAPEIFNYKKYLEANEALMPDKILEINGSTEPAIMYGMDVITVAGDENNYKITTDADLKKFKDSVVC